MSQIPQRREHPVREVLCPHCNGGNVPNAVVCRWCGAVLQIPERGYTQYTPPSQQQFTQPPQRSKGVPGANNCLGTLLLVLGVMGILGSFLITASDLSGANVFQAQPIILTGIMLVLGSFLLFMLPGILLMRKK